MFQISFATDCTRIRLLDYAIFIILIEAANGFVWIEHMEGGETWYGFLHVHDLDRYDD